MSRWALKATSTSPFLCVFMTTWNVSALISRSNRFVEPGRDDLVAMTSNLLELMLDSPETFFPTDEERESLRWYAGDRSLLAPSDR